MKFIEPVLDVVELLTVSLRMDTDEGVQFIISAVDEIKS